MNRGYSVAFERYNRRSGTFETKHISVQAQNVAAAKAMVRNRVRNPNYSDRNFVADPWLR